MSLTNKQKAVLNIAANQLGLDDDTKRDAYEAHAGVRSAMAMDQKGFRAVMRHFEKSGFKNRVTRDKRRDPVIPRKGMATERQIRKIKAMWYSLGGAYYERGKEWKALRAFLKNRIGVAHEKFLTFDKAYAAIEAIKAIQERHP